MKKYKNANKARRIDWIILVTTLILLVFSVVLFLQGSKGVEENVSGNNLFSFQGGRILIDDDMNFEGARVFDAKDRLVISLQPGNYYWKIEGEEEIAEINANNEMVLVLRESAEGFDVLNAGVSEMDVAIYNRGKYTGNAILEGFGGRYEASEVIYIGGENE